MTGLITNYLAEGLAADRPVTPSITTGALAIYYATDTNDLSIWDGSTWVPGTVGALLIANNLSDLASASTARTNLGLGSAAVLSTSDVDERARDAVGTALVEGTGIDITVNDGADTITIATTGVALTSGATFSGDVEVPDEAYGVGWNGSVEVPTKNAVYDKIENVVGSKPTESIIVAASDESTALTTGTAKVTFRMPYAFTLSAVKASLTTAQASGSIFTVDINESGTTILSTKLTIDNTEKTSTTAVTAPVISDTSLADDAEMTIDIDQVGDGTAKGLKVTLIGMRT